MKATDHSKERVQRIASVTIMAIALLLTSARCLGAIQVLEPNGGEVYTTGGMMTIRWSGGLGLLSISLSRDGGASWTEITKYYNVGEGIYYWFSVTGPASTTCRIGVSSVSITPSDRDMSDGNFTIRVPVTPPSVSVAAATSVTATTATLNGAVANDGGAACQYQFRYKKGGGSYAYTSYAGSKWTGESFSQALTGLDPGARYYFAARAKNSAGESDWPASDLSFGTPAEYTLRISATKGGRVEPSEGTYTYADGAEVWMTAVPDSGYRFTNWSGSLSSTSNPQQITMTCDHQVQANFVPTDLPDRPALGFSLRQWTFDDPQGFDDQVRTNNFQHAENHQYDRMHVQLVKRLGPDPAGMMRMRNLRDLDPASATHDEMICARATLPFEGYNGARMLVRFAYLFEQSAPGLELTARLSDVPDLLDRTNRASDRHYVYIGQVPAPPEGRPGSIGSRRFGVFEGWVSAGPLDLSKGVYIEMELVQTGGQAGTASLSHGAIRLASSEGDGGSALIDDLAVEVHCDGICLDLNWSDTADEEDFLLVIASCGHGADLIDGGIGSRYCLDGVFSSDSYVDSYDVHSWDWALNDTSRVVCNYCRVPLPLADADSGTSGRPLLQSPSTADLKPAGIGGLPGDVLVLGKGRMKTAFSDLLKDGYSFFDNQAAYQGGYTIAGLPDRCDIRVVRGPTDDVYAVNTESGVLRIDGRVETVIAPGRTSIGSDPRYGGPATVYVGIQGQGSDSFGRPVLDVAFDGAGSAYVVPVVVQPVASEPYVAAARLQLRQSGNPTYRVVQLYDDPPLPGDNQRRDYLREIEIDGAGNVYLVNVHALNESCILWKYGPDGTVKRRVDLMSPSSPAKIPDPIALHVSHDGQMLYLASGQRDLQTPDSTVLYGLSTQDFSLMRSVTIRNMEQVTSVTQDPATGCLWVAGVSMPEIPTYPSPMDEPFYVPFLAKILPQTGTVDAICIANPDRYNLALPTSIVWVGARQ